MSAEEVTPAREEVARAADVLRRGGLVAFPTETVYGLGADAASPDALRRLYGVKRRPAGHPVIVHLASPEWLGTWATEVPPVAARLAAACWPGPLTLVLERRPGVPDEVTGGQQTVGLRVPDQPVALALLREFGGGVAAPSANRFGRVSPTTADHVRRDLGGDVDVVLDGGPCRVGVESTIVDCHRGDPVILRVGGVPRERIEQIVSGPVAIADGDRGDGGAVRAPGSLPSHYAPRARVVVLDAARLVACAHEAARAGVRVGVVAPDPPDGLPPSVVVLGTPAGTDAYARGLYRYLRDADARHLDIVLAVPPPPDGLGLAVADRLRRAAAPR